MDFDRLSAFLPFVKSLWKVFSPSIYLPSTQGIVGVEREEDSFLLQKQEHAGRMEQKSNEYNIFTVLQFLHKRRDMNTV